MRTEEFNWKVPQELIAQEPATPRDSSRLLVLYRNTGKIEHLTFRDIGQYLYPGDVLVINNTKVVPVRLPLDDSRVILLLKRIDDKVWQALGEKGAFARGDTFSIGRGEVWGRVIEHEGVIGMLGESMIKVGFSSEEYLADIGKVPLPPYIHSYKGDPTRYQTVYASVQGSSAAPTAGFHFTPELLNSLKEKGVGVAEITLHVSVDTFLPVVEEDATKHKIYTEYVQVTKEAAQRIRKAERVICVGTTSVRTLEQMYTWKGKVAPCEGFADIFILPGYKFHFGGLVTNFHYPRSSNLMLTAAFAGSRDLLHKAYQDAVQIKYRFYSFGDAMLIL